MIGAVLTSQFVRCRAVAGVQGHALSVLTSQLARGAKLGGPLELLLLLVLVLDEQLVQVVLEPLLPHQVVLLVRQATTPAVSTPTPTATAAAAVTVLQLSVIRLIAHTRVIAVALAVVLAVTVAVARVMP